MKKPPWEATYGDVNTKSFGDVSQEISDLIPRLPIGSKVLDVGCGDGRNAIPLARAGCAVTAIDISESGIRKLKTQSEREGLDISASVADMTTYSYEDMYDLIIAHGCLHLVHRKQREMMIESFKSHTVSSGYNVIAAFTDQIPVPPDLDEFCIGLFREGELYEKYTGWEIILQKSYVFQDEHPGGIRHTHAANKIVAKNCRPNSFTQKSQTR